MGISRRVAQSFPRSFAEFVWTQLRGTLRKTLRTSRETMLSIIIIPPTLLIRILHFVFPLSPFEIQFTKSVIKADAITTERVFIKTGLRKVVAFQSAVKIQGPVEKVGNAQAEASPFVENLLLQADVIHPKGGTGTL